VETGPFHSHVLGAMYHRFDRFLGFTVIRELQQVQSMHDC